MRPPEHSNQRDQRPPILQRRYSRRQSLLPTSHQLHNRHRSAAELVLATQGLLDTTQQMPEGSSAKSKRSIVKRSILWIIATACLILTGLLYFHFWISRPVGRGPAGPAVAHEPFVQIWTRRPVLLVGLGDS